MDNNKIREIRQIRENPRFRRYPEYKESGLEWVGEIPAHWETKAVWMMFRLGRGRVISNEEIGTNPGQYPVYSSQTENEGIMGYIDTYDFDGNYITWTTDGAKAGTVFYRTGQFNCTNVCGTLSPKNQDLDLRFFRHALNIVTSQFVRYDINPKLMNNVMAKIRVQVPSETEQVQIANFLDRKTGQIDELIRIKERRIELLQEQRTALINQVVTKGLDPNVEMKPSGVEWIGEIPKNWGMKQLKYIADLNMGQSPPSEGYNSDQFGTPFLQGNAEFGAHHPTPKIYCPTAKKYANQGDILLSVRAPVGAINIANQEYGIGRGLCAIRPRANQLKHRYAKYLLGIVRAELHAVATGSTYDAVTVDEVSNVTCVVPSLSEQAQISDFLDRKTEQIDELISAEQRKIELLKEYRQSLISEAVTGKIDV